MTPSREQCLGAAELALAGGLALFGLFDLTKAPFLIALAASVGGNWVADLTVGTFREWCETQFTEHDALNHDIVRALGVGFQDAVRQLERDWPKQPEYQGLSYQLQGITRQVLGYLREDAQKIFMQETFPVATLERDEVIGLLRTNTAQEAEQQARALLETALRNYLAGRTEALVTFVIKRLPGEWLTRFRERLKDPRPEGTKSWRAYQMLVQDRMLADLAEIKQLVRQLLQNHPHDDAATLEAAEKLLAELPLTTVPDPSALPTRSRMPLARNPLFVGREDDLQALAEALRGGEAVAVSPAASLGLTAAATGIGGIGKTQLAIEFVHRYGQYFAGGVFWLTFADAGTMPTEVASCGGAGHMDLRPDFHDLPQQQQIQAVRGAWQQKLPRLLIFDNCEDEALFKEWRPTSGACRVLITSRRAHWDATLNIQAHPLDLLPRTESIALLRNYRPDIADADADAIAHEVGDLPLALHLAGHYMRVYSREVTPAEYLGELRAELLAHPSLQGEDMTISPTDHELHVASTIALSYRRLDATNATDKLALDLLARASFLAPGEPIPYDLLLAILEPPDKSVRRQVRRALTRLVNLGLMNEEDEQFKLHRLIVAFVRKALPEQDEAAIPERVEERLLAEIERLLNDERLTELRVLKPHRYFVYDAAHERTIQIFERVFGEIDPRLSDNFQKLGDLAGQESNYDEARAFHEWALHINETAYGSDHPRVSWSMDELAELAWQLAWQQVELETAQQFSERALAIVESAYGAEDPRIIPMLTSLGDLAERLEVFETARVYYKQALHIAETALDPDRPPAKCIRKWLAEIEQRIQEEQSE